MRPFLASATLAAAVACASAAPGKIRQEVYLPEALAAKGAAQILPSEQRSSCATETRPKPGDVKEFVADPIPSHLPGDFKDFKIAQTDLAAVLRDYVQVSEDHWKHRYSHVAFGDRTGHVVLKDGRKLKWMVKPGGLAWLEFPRGFRMFLAKEKSARAGPSHSPPLPHFGP